MDISLLADLLKQANNGNEDDDGLDMGSTGPSPYANPGAIGHAASAGTELTNMASDGDGSKDIWHDDEVGERGEHEYDDPRPQPNYEMIYKQAVSTEDVFLGMGNKTPTTAGCEDLIVRINLQDTAYKDVELIIAEQFLDCRSPKYRLGLHLPHKVDEEKCSAKWLSEQCILEVSLRLVRPFDDLNQ